VRIVLVAGSTAGAVTLFLTLARPGRLIASLGSPPPTCLLAAVGATMAGVMLGAVRWRSLLSAGGVQTPAPRLFAALTIGSAVNNLVPARGGDAVRVESAHQLTGAPRLAVAGTMLSERILDGFVLAPLIVAGAFLEGVGGGSSGSERHSPAESRWLHSSWAGSASAWLRGRLSGIERGLAVFRTTRVVALALGVTAGIWLADVVMYGALARGFHLDLSVAQILLLVGAGNLALAIPGAAAGIGSFELVTLAGTGSAREARSSLPSCAVHAVIVLPPTLTGAMLARVALPKAFRLRREPGGVAA
jgi:uncharacterized membrane protein YbhN (UPF0104 family)